MSSLDNMLSCPLSLQNKTKHANDWSCQTNHQLVVLLSKFNPVTATVRKAIVSFTWIKSYSTTSKTMHTSTTRKIYGSSRNLMKAFPLNSDHHHQNEDAIPRTSSVGTKPMSVRTFKSGRSSRTARSMIQLKRSLSCIMETWSA